MVNTSQVLMAYSPLGAMGISKDRGFPTRMVYLHYILCLRYTILVGNPQYVSTWKHPHREWDNQTLGLLLLRPTPWPLGQRGSQKQTYMQKSKTKKKKNPTQTTLGGQPELCHSLPLFLTLTVCVQLSQTTTPSNSSLTHRNLLTQLLRVIMRFCQILLDLHEGCRYLSTRYRCLLPAIKGGQKKGTLTPHLPH